MAKSIKTPDLKAPRYKLQGYNTIDSDFLNQVKQQRDLDITDSEIRNIIKTFNETAAQMVVEKREGIQLPSLMGKIFVGTCQKKKTPNIDYRASWGKDKIIEHRNWESDNYLAKIFYSSYGMEQKFEHSEVFGFKACRTFSRHLSKVYPIEWKKFMIIDPHMKISQIFRKTKIEHEVKERTESLITTYDEFEF